MTSKKIKNMLVYILVIIVAALVALPFIWMVVSAFKSQRELFAYPPTFFPDRVEMGKFYGGRVPWKYQLLGNVSEQYEDCCTKYII
ncbi:MAG: hypothetical protein ACLTUZ_01325 [Sellimonas intestinalis]|uniref:hypothetical protein n=1 Tax=Sellimonas intestinalis TaxID=1653434 RepID=UPI0039928385